MQDVPNKAVYEPDNDNRNMTKKWDGACTNEAQLPSNDFPNTQSATDCGNTCKSKGDQCVNFEYSNQTKMCKTYGAACEQEDYDGSAIFDPSKEAADKIDCTGYLYYGRLHLKEGGDKLTFKQMVQLPYVRFAKGLHEVTCDHTQFKGVADPAPGVKKQCFCDNDGFYNETKYQQDMATFKA